MKEKVTIIGAGSWGTTLATLLVQKQHPVDIWTHSPQHLPETPARVLASMAAAVENSSVLIIAVASQFYRQTLTALRPLLKDTPYLLSATKGLEMDTGKRMAEVMAEVLPDHRKHMAVLSGPNLSREIADQKPAASVIASEDASTADFFQALLSTPLFRLYTNPDVIGVELGGTLKNAIAIAAGAADGFNLGNNAKAGLMVRGIAETTRLGVALGAQASTFSGLSGMGDLIATCSSPLSRNYQVGMALAAGETRAEIEHRMTEVAEGISTARVAADLAQKKNVEVPIIQQVYEVLYHQKNPYDAIYTLMTRDLKKE